MTQENGLGYKRVVVAALGAAFIEGMLAGKATELAFGIDYIDFSEGITDPRIIYEKEYDKSVALTADNNNSIKVAGNPDSKTQKNIYLYNVQEDQNLEISASHIPFSKREDSFYFGPRALDPDEPVYIAGEFGDNYTVSANNDKLVFHDINAALTINNWTAATSPRAIMIEGFPINEKRIKIGNGILFRTEADELALEKQFEDGSTETFTANEENKLHIEIEDQLYKAEMLKKNDGYIDDTLLLTSDIGGVEVARSTLFGHFQKFSQ